MASSKNRWEKKIDFFVNTASYVNNIEKGFRENRIKEYFLGYIIKNEFEYSKNVLRLDAYCKGNLVYKYWNVISEATFSDECYLTLLVAQTNKCIVVEISCWNTARLSLK